MTRVKVLFPFSLPLSLTRSFRPFQKGHTPKFLHFPISPYSSVLSMKRSLSGAWGLDTHTHRVRHTHSCTCRPVSEGIFFSSENSPGWSRLEVSVCRLISLYVVCMRAFVCVLELLMSSYCVQCTKHADSKSTFSTKVQKEKKKRSAVSCNHQKWCWVYDLGL